MDLPRIFIEVAVHRIDWLFLIFKREEGKEHVGDVFIHISAII